MAIASASDAHQGEAAKVAGGARFAKAERDAEQGNLAAALTAVLDAEPRIVNASVGLRANQDYALRLAVRILARAEKPPLEGFPNDEEQMKWAYLQVRKLREAAPTPSLSTDFGEIASRIPTERIEAQKILETLDRDQTMASAFGYAALARLRREIGQDTAKIAGAPLRALSAASSEVAVLRCKKMAIGDKKHCDTGLIATPGSLR
jgi:hypothetical protein